MKRFRIIIPLASIIFVFSLMGFHLDVAKGQEQWKKNHVSAGQGARSLMKGRPAQTNTQDSIKQLVRLLHDTDHFFHLNRKHLRQFSKPGFSLDAFSDKLSKRIEQLEKKPGDGKKKKEIKKLKRDLAGLDRAYAAYTKAYARHNTRDWPFCLAGEQYIRLEVIDGCTSFAKAFMTLANAVSLFDDMRLIISKRYEDLEEHIDLLGTGKVPPKTINGHQMVLVKDGNHWYLVNVTFYREGGKKGVERFEILDKINGVPVDPRTILYKEIKLPTMEGQNLRRLVAAAVGKNRYDDLGVHTWELAACIGTSIPRAAFDALASVGEDAQRNPNSMLDLKDRKLLASLDQKNTALFWKTVAKGIKIRKSGATEKEVIAALQGPLKTLSQNTGISYQVLSQLANNLSMDTSGDLVALREALRGQKRLRYALQKYKTELENALEWASQHNGIAQVQFKDYALDANGLFVEVPDAVPESDTQDAENLTATTGSEHHSSEAIQQELAETNAQLQAVEDTIAALESQINQLQA